MSKLEICTEFAGLLPLEAATGNDLFQVVKEFLINDLRLSLNEMVGVSSEAPIIYAERTIRCILY